MTNALPFPPSGPRRRSVLGAEWELPQRRSRSADAGACVRCLRAEECNEGLSQIWLLCSEVQSSDKTSSATDFLFFVCFVVSCVSVPRLSRLDTHECTESFTHFVPFFYDRGPEQKRPASSIFSPPDRMMK